MLAMLLALATTFPTATGYVTDAAGKLDAGTRAALDQRLRDYERRTGNEVAVVTVATLDGDAIATYANGLFHAWGIGKRGKDNGVLLLWAPTERKVRIEVGYGLEGVLPDGRAGQIIRDAITPRFRNNDWAGGLNAGIDAILTQLDRQATPAATPTPATTHGSIWVGLLFLSVLCAFPFAIALAVRRAQRNRRREEERRLAYAAAVRPVRRADYFPPTPVEPVVVVASAPTEHKSYSDTSRTYSDTSSSWSSSSSGGGYDSGGSFGGGDSGGGGADGSY